MKVLLSLIKINLNVNFGISALKYRFTKEKKRLWEPVFALIGIIIGIGSLVAFYSLFLFSLFVGGKSIGQPEIVLTIAFIATQLLVMIFGIFYIISSFYFSKDMNILVPLPIKPSQVLAAKFFTILVNEYLTVLPVLIPAFVIYEIGMDVDLFYWLKAIILALTAPILPLAIAALFVVVIMRFINIRKNKDLLMIIGSFLGIFLGLAINFFVQQIPEGSEEEFIRNLVESQKELIKSIGAKFPPSLWATYSLSEPGFSSLGYFTLFVGISILLLGALIWIGNRIFYKGLLSGQEIHRRNKSLSTQQLEDRSTKTSSPLAALFWKEWRLFLRTPIYVMNGLVGMLIVPLFMLMPLFTQEGELNKLLSQLRLPEFGLIVTLGALAVSLFTASINIVACTSVSREGSTFWISKIIPVSAKIQILAKLIHSAAISFIGIFVVIIAIQLLAELSLLRITTLIILGILGSLGLNIINLIIDVLRPKLDWNDPQEAVKQNFNGFLGILLPLIVMALLAGLVAILVLVKTPEWLIYLIIAIIMVIADIIGLYGLFALAEHRYASIEI